MPRLEAVLGTEQDKLAVAPGQGENVKRKWNGNHLQKHIQKLKNPPTPVSAEDVIVRRALST